MEIIKTISRYFLREELDAIYSSIDTKDRLIEQNKETIFNLTYPNPKEEYYNNKYPKFQRVYQKKFLDYYQNLDVRCFVGNHNNYQLPIFDGEDDKKAISSLSWVIKNFKYVPDKQVFGLQEYWAFSFESLVRKQGDCDDGAILLYDVLRANGIPAWKLRITAGDAVNPFTKQIVGHAYLTYYSEVEDKWVALDWCYFPNTEEMELQPHYKDIGFYGDVWFSFNELYSWGEKKIQ